MVVNPATTALPITTVNPPTEAVRKDAERQERIPESRPGTESQGLRQSNNQDSADTQIFDQEGQIEDEGSEEQSQQQSDSDRDEAGANSAASDNRNTGVEEEASSTGEFFQERTERQEAAEIRELEQIDRAVREHEAAHARVGGQLAGSPSFVFKTGPDGARYAVAGEVSIDVSEVPNDPEATIRKLQQVRRAALAPADPSAQDQRVASRAAAGIAEARAELAADELSGEADSTRGSLRTEREPLASDEETVATDSRQRFESRLRSLGVLNATAAGDQVSLRA
ncbi:putative metalloprotease CJM1_0395 family protein [Pleionea sp. CnH1-48]|uniref:putative metalloprotease CJM1_0395 family protein n=1 Tax=Pleionea sp. CnH1-48 TaxID=2954494 RepID=UPI002096A1B5|nr:putative metalloprotease CJM1_0395 family protein [Pleionea sp. CnH1-48]MCO7225709.1 hypothetical protein [Pleionea sp. CnH1-48]